MLINIDPKETPELIQAINDLYLRRAQANPLQKEVMDIAVRHGIQPVIVPQLTKESVRIENEITSTGKYLDELTEVKDALSDRILEWMQACVLDYKDGEQIGVFIKKIFGFMADWFEVRGKRRDNGQENIEDRAHKTSTFIKNYEQVNARLIKETIKSGDPRRIAVLGLMRDHDMPAALGPQLEALRECEGAMPAEELELKVEIELINLAKLHAEGLGIKSKHYFDKFSARVRAVYKALTALPDAA